jgi:metal transporter CNNM
VGSNAYDVLRTMMITIRTRTVVSWPTAALLVLLLLVQQQHGGLAARPMVGEEEQEDPEAIARAIATLLANTDLIVCAPNDHAGYLHGGHGDDEEDDEYYDPIYFSMVPLCSQVLLPPPRETTTNYARRRHLSPEEEDASTAPDSSSSTRNIIVMVGNAIGALLCVTLAALAAGLTLGLLGLDPLVLLIKERAGPDPQERQMARKLLPVIQQHHRLLVTLLLLNAMANEALPLFLEALVSPALAVIISVTLVLFFGEIIPSAIFTGPDQLHIATKLLPLVRVILWLAYPIAVPIAKLLDVLLHEKEDEDDHDGPPSHGTSAAYTRGELSALIRIQYEERLAKRRHKQKKQRQMAHNMLYNNNNNIIIDDDDDDLHRNDEGTGLSDHYDQAALDTTTTPGSFRSTGGSPQRTASFRTTVQRQLAHGSETSDFFDVHGSIRHDEVLMVEGALHMSTKVALDVFTPMRNVFSIPADMILTEANLVKIYAAGHARVPVYKSPPGDNPLAICGILMTRYLIVVNSGGEKCSSTNGATGHQEEGRSVSTLPLRIPQCVPPTIALVDLLNLLQHGGSSAKAGGHLALVCARPDVAAAALAEPGGYVPEQAGLMGIVTLEDVLEMLLQEVRVCVCLRYATAAILYLVVDSAIRSHLLLLLLPLTYQPLFLSDRT